MATLHITPKVLYTFGEIIFPKNGLIALISVNWKMKDAYLWMDLYFFPYDQPLTVVSLLI